VKHGSTYNCSCTPLFTGTHCERKYIIIYYYYTYTVNSLRHEQNVTL